MTAANGIVNKVDTRGDNPNITLKKYIIAAVGINIAVAITVNNRLKYIMSFMID